MATYTVTACKHQTLAASTVDTVNFGGAESVVVQNRGASGDIYCTVGMNSATAATPTVAGDDTIVVVANSAITISRPDEGVVTSVKLISSGTPSYSVMGL